MQESASRPDDKKKRKKNNAYTDDTLLEILEQYPEINAREDIECFVQVYYPIAVIDMTLYERSFENIDIINSTILKLINSGVTDHAEIADILGLSEKYVGICIKTLMGYNQISQDGKMTEVGLDSLKENKLVKLFEVTQQFQIDALNGNLLRLDNCLDKRLLFNRDETNGNIGHISYIEGVERSYLEEQLTERKLSELIQCTNETNIESVKSIDFKEIKYVSGFMIQLKGWDVPIVFTKRFDLRNRTNPHKWLPFGVANRDIIYDSYEDDIFCKEDFFDKYGFSYDTPINTDNANEYILSIKNLLDLEKMTLEQFKNTLSFVFVKKYGFDFDSIETLNNIDDLYEQILNRRNKPLDFVVDETKLQYFRSSLLNLLLNIQQNGIALVTHPRLYGLNLSVTDASGASELGSIAARLFEKHPKIKVLKAINAEFRDYKGSDLFEKLKKFMENLEKKKQITPEEEE